MNKFYVNLLRTFVLFLCIGISQFSLAQTTITTPYTGGFTFFAAPANIAFVVENSNSSPVTLTGVGQYCDVDANNSVWELYYSATSLSGVGSPVPGSSWNLIATSSAVSVPAAGIVPVFTSLSFVIPANTQYRFVMRGLGPGNVTYQGSPANPAINLITDNGINLKTGDNQIAGANVGYSGSGTTLTTTPRYWHGSLTFAPMGPCTDPPNPGTITSTATTACTGSNFTVSLSGGTTGSGQTYQWQRSADNSTWTNISGATAGSLTTSQTTSTYYRVAVTCGSTVNSSSILVNTPPAVSGTFDINNGIPTGGTNFQTFAEAINYIKCGINGPVTFNVSPGGTYTEQVVIPAIGGASATNKIVFNGNGALINFNSTNTNQRAAFLLDGADYVTIDNFIISGSGTTTSDYNFGVHLTNGADHNIIKNNTLNIYNAITSTNYAGIAISGTTSSATTTGSNSDYNIIDSNTINGGYYGITVLGAAGSPAVGNKITNNKIQDWYFYGVYASNTDSILIEKNDINRMTRSANASTFNGVYFTSLSENARVSKNMIHDPFGGISSTSAAYGIYFTASDAAAGKENVVSNNLIYNFNGGGIQYALYNSSSDGVWYFHNTVVLDDLSYTGTSVTRGFYQLTAASNIQIKNNIIMIARGGAGLKYNLYFGTTTSTIISDNNVLYNASTAGTNGIGFYSSGFTTLPDWKAANNSAYDQASVSADPLFTAPGSDYKPTNPQIDNIGANVGIATDIVDSTRNIGSPDPGAYEFSLGTCTNPPTAGTAVSSLATVCVGATFTLNLTGNSVGDGQKYQWQSSPDDMNWTNIDTASNASAYALTQTGTTYYRARITCGNGTPVFSSSVLVTSPALVSGTFDINNGIPTGGGNFQTFADAISHIRCGINGPVVFNVAAGGTYTEQVVIPEISGASATNTITINGNGAVINFNSTVTSERAAILLDGADHVIVKNFIINGTGTTTSDYNFGIQLTNGADSNIVKGNTINLTAASTSSNFAGIVISGSTSSATTTGSNADYNLIDSNTINGGYYGITLLGVGGTPAVGNMITNNKVQDWYFYGMYMSNTDSTLIEKNDVNRLTRSVNTSTFNGIYFTSLNENARVSKNRVHDPFGGITSTSAAYGIYFTGSDATTGNENIVSNNLVYNFNGGGIIYGLYNNSSNGVYYYHNTVVLDDQSYSGSSVTRGFYQLTTADNIRIFNNIILISRGGTGLKYNLYFGTAASSITSNRNILFNTSSAGTNGIGFYSTGYTTLADWQAANNNAFDQQSRSLDPMFANPGGSEFIPTSSLADNMGAPVGVLTDIRDSLRSTTTPDAGAYEFSTLTAGTNMSAVSLVTPALQSNGCYSANETVTVRIRNASTSPIDFSTNPVTVTTQVTGAVNQTLSAIVNSGTLASDSTMNVVMTTTLNMSAPGAYTFNASTSINGDVNTANDGIIPVTRTKQALTAGNASGPGGFCAPTPVNTTLSSMGIAGSTSLQWLQSTSANSGYTAISGADTVPYTVTTTPSQTMYYKLVARCAAQTDTSAVVTVTYNNPQVTATTPGSRCGSGTVTLGATGSNGTTLEWYAAATGGAPLATGPSFTTPSLSVDSTYFYVAANIAGGSGGASPLLVTEIDLGGSDQIEIQNVSGTPVDVTGWKVALSDSYTDINSVNAIVQTLSGVMNPGETKTWTDQSTAPNYWGNNILYNPGAFPSFSGWAAILDNNNNLVDIVFLNWTSSNIQGAAIPIGSATITIGNKWTGDGVNTTTVAGTESVSRQGTSDNNSLSDFTIQALSIGTTNPGMSLPFTGFGCSSSRTPVLAKTNDCPVPVTLLNFKGEKVANINKLDWTTVTEINNAGFELQRSADGINFSQLSYLPSKAANGSSNAALTYSFDDVRPFAGNSYYRLKQIDKDGRQSFSQIVLIKGARFNVVSITSIYPNPAKNDLNLVISSPTAERVNVLLTDLSGKMVMQHSARVVSGDNQVKLVVDKLASGTYFIKMVCANGCEGAVHKFVKQ